VGGDGWFRGLVMHSADAIKNVGITAATQMIRENIAVDDRWLMRGLLAIYNRQTASERASECTIQNNGIGFNGADAQILTSFAKQVIKWEAQQERRYATPLSPRQTAIARRKLHKYCGQLARIAQGKA